MAVKRRCGPMSTLAQLPSEPMSCSIPHRHLWSAERLSAADLRALLDATTDVRRAKQRDAGWAPLRGRNLALLADAGDGAAPAFESAARELGGTVTRLDTRAWQTSAGAHTADALRMLGRLYDAVDCYGVSSALLDQIDAHCGVPVFNGLARADHPLCAVGALLTMRELSGQPLERLQLQLNGDPESPRCRAVAALARLAVIDVRSQAGVAVGAADTQGDAPNFTFDTFAAPGAADRLTMPDASVDTQARIAAMLGDNCRCALQALLVCGMQ
jgi:ornithine carbamoyltransferase